MKNKLTYIKIVSCDSTTAWYRSKIGRIFPVDKDVSFPDVHTIRISRRKDKANWGIVDHSNAQVLKLNFVERFFLGVWDIMR